MAKRRLPGIQRQIRQRFPRPRPQNCCSYHRQDWALASETAIRLLAPAQAEGITGEPDGWRVVELAKSEGLAPDDIAAVECLVDTLDPISLDDDGGIYEGRHRIQAMIDQGVTRTVLLHLVLLDPATWAGNYGRPTNAARSCRGPRLGQDLPVTKSRWRCTPQLCRRSPRVDKGVVC